MHVSPVQLGPATRRVLPGQGAGIVEREMPVDGGLPAGHWPEGAVVLARAGDIGCADQGGMVTVRQSLQHLPAVEGAAAPGVDGEPPLGTAWVRGLPRERLLVSHLEGSPDYLPATGQPAKSRILDKRIEAPLRRLEGDR